MSDVDDDDEHELDKNDSLRDSPSSLSLKFNIEVGRLPKKAHFIFRKADLSLRFTFFFFLLQRIESKSRSCYSTSRS